MPAGSLVNLFSMSASPDGRVSEAWTLFGTIAVLLAVFVLAIGIMVLRRWFARRLSPPRTDKSETADAWAESARRIKPYDSRDE